MFRADRTWLLRVVLGITLVGVGIWIYGDLGAAGLTNWDDDRFTTANPLFTAGGWPYIRAALTQIQFEAYHPLHVLSYLPDRYLWPTWPPGFHLVNLGLFATDVILVWRLVRRHTSELAAFAAVALFALHPVCVEPAAWVADRKEPLMVLFFVLALGRETAHTERRPRAGAVVLLLCALLAKSSSVCFPVVLFAWLRWIQDRPLREAVVRSAGYAAVAIAVSVVVVAIWQDHGMIVHRTASPPVEVATTLVAYARHVFWPVDLGPVYPLDAQHATAAVVVCALAAVALAVSWRWLPPRARFTAVAVAGALLPVSNLVPMTLRLSDRYLFIVMAMLVLPVASALDWIVARARPRLPRVGVGVGVIVAVVAGLEASASARLARAWRSSRTLWAHAIEAQPGAFLAHLKLAEVLEAERRWPETLAQLRAAQELNPGNPLPEQRLLHLDAKLAELRGLLAPGTAARWWTESEQALVDRDAYHRLVAEVDATPCQACGDALALMGVNAWPFSDDELLSAAQQALDRGVAGRARTYLVRVRDRARRELEQLEHRASAPPAAAGRTDRKAAR